MTLLLEWARALSPEIQRLKAELAQGPFGEGSLFAKTLSGILTPGQLAEYRRMPSAVSTKSQMAVASVGPDAAFTKADRDARLAEILAAWEESSSRIDRLECQFTRFRYDRVFQVEWRGTGALAVDKSGRAMYRVGPEPIKLGEKGQKRAPNGAPYELKSEEPADWNWTGKSVIWTNEEARTYQELRLSPGKKPNEYQPDPPPLPVDVVQDLALWKVDWLEAMREFPLARPFLLGMNVAALKNRFHVELKKETDTEIWLTMVPKLKKEQANFSEAVLILSRDRYRPMAVKVIDPTGTETVHVFKNVQFNPPGIVEDLERPNLDGYMRIN